MLASTLFRNIFNILSGNYKSYTDDIPSIEINKVNLGSDFLNLKKATKEEIEQSRCKQYDFIA